MQVPPLFCDEFEFELFPREFELLLEAIWFPVLFALGPPKMKFKNKIKKVSALSKVIIVGVVALWGDCMAFPADQEFW